MAIRILDCAPMSPWFPRWHIGGTCLLIDTDKGLVLVDTGLGLHDYANPTTKVKLFRFDFGSHNDPETTAVRQIERLGHSPQSVPHLIMTHLHFDHAGGLPDFPDAQVHVHRREYEAMRHPRTWIELAYDKSDFAHRPSWVLYDQPNSTWLGLEAIRLPFSPRCTSSLSSDTPAAIVESPSKTARAGCSTAPTLCRLTPNSISRLAGSTVWSLGPMSHDCGPGRQPIPKSACLPGTCGERPSKRRTERPNNSMEPTRPAGCLSSARY